MEVLLLTRHLRFNCQGWGPENNAMFQGNYLAIIRKHVTSLHENMCDTCEDVDHINQFSQLESPVRLTWRHV